MTNPDTIPNADPTAMRGEGTAERLVAQVRDADERLAEQGYGMDSYMMALAYVAGKHRLPMTYIGKIDQLYHDRIPRGV